MCITMDYAELSSTYLFTAELSDGSRSLIYQCKASSDQPNALMFVVPTSGKLSADNFVNLEKVPKLLSGFVKAYQDAQPKSRSASRSESFSLGVGFTQVGGWAVTYSNGGSFEEICELIASLPESKRPAVNADVIKGFAKLGLPFVIAGFEGEPAGSRGWGSTTKELHPLGVRYTEPLYPEHLIFPMLDGHGEFPQDLKPAKRDHYVFSARGDVGAAASLYTVNLDNEFMACPEIAALIPLSNVDGGVQCSFDAGRLDQYTRNGDMAVKIADLYSEKTTIKFFMPGSPIV
jgi:hypothetical protein